MAGGWVSGLGWRYDGHGECEEISGAERVRSDVQSDVWVFSGDGDGAEVYLFARGAGTEEREDLSLSREPDGGRRETDFGGAEGADAVGEECGGGGGECVEAGELPADVRAPWDCGRGEAGAAERVSGPVRERGGEVFSGGGGIAGGGVS